MVLYIITTLLTNPEMLTDFIDLFVEENLNVLANLARFLPLGLGDVAFDVIQAAKTFILQILNPAALVGALLTGGLIPGLDASKITSGQFPIALIEGLEIILQDEVVKWATMIKAFLPGVTTGTFETFEFLAQNLMLLLGNPPLLDELFDRVAAIEPFVMDVLGPSGLIPVLIDGLLDSVVIPGLDATIITTGQFAISMIEGLEDALTAVSMNWNALVEAFFPDIQDGGQAQFNTIIQNLMSFLGGPDLANAIFDPVDAAFVFIGDLVGRAPGLLATLTGGLLTPGQEPALLRQLMDTISNIVNSDITAVQVAVNNFLTQFSPLNAINIFNQILPGQMSLIPVSQIGTVSPELLTNPGFDGSNSLSGQSVWIWDGAVGRTALGSAKANANGTTRELLSNVMYVTAGQQFNFSSWAKWTTLTAAGGSNPIRLDVAKYLNGSLVGNDTIDSFTDPPTNQATWQQLAGSYTVPAGCDSIRLRLVITDQATLGTVWFDDSSATKIGLIQKDFISGLIDDLLSLLSIETWQGFLDDITGAVVAGTGTVSAFLTRISSLTIDGLFDASQLTNIVNIVAGIPQAAVNGLTTLNIAVSQIGEIFDDLVVTPINTVVAQVQSWFGVITSFQEAIQGFFSAFIANIVGIISGVPIVGGTLAAQASAALYGAFGGLLNAFQTGISGAATAEATSDTVAAALSTSGAALGQVSQEVSGISEQLQQTVLGNSFGGPPTENTTTGFGSSWTVNQPTWVNIELASNVGYRLIPSGNSTRLVIAMHNDGPTLSDHQSGRIMFKNIMESVANVGNELIMRADSLSNPQNYIYLRFYYNQIELGYCKTGTRYFWKNFDVAPSWGVTYNLICGTKDGDYEFELFVNGVLLGTYSDTAQDSMKGSGYREGGMFFRSAPGASTEAQPASVQYWKLQDNLTNGVIGSGFRVMRTDTTGVLFAGGSGAFQIPANFYDVDPKWMSADWSWNRTTNLFTCTKAGQYNFKLNLPFLASNGLFQTSSAAWSALLAVDGQLVDYGQVIASGAIGLHTSFVGIQLEAGSTVGPVYQCGSGGALTISGGYGTQTAFEEIMSTFTGVRVQ